MASWIPIPPDSDFSLANLPFGIVSRLDDDDATPRVGVAVGESVVDLGFLSTVPQFQQIVGLGADAPAVLNQPTLNAFAALGRTVHRSVREALRSILVADPGTKELAFLRDSYELRTRAVVPQTSVAMHLPMEIGDYTDFYAGVHHARNVGSLFRDPQNPLPRNYGTLPIAYHGRASSVVVSGTPVQRPCGQILVPGRAADGSAPSVSVGPSRKLDFELELGCFMSRPNAMGTPIRVQDAEAHIFGYVLLNDWSARDIQSYEYVPLGPFSGKNFMTSISPWVVLADALEPFRVPIKALPETTFPYLNERSTMFDLHLAVDLTLPGHSPVNITQVSSNNLQWSFSQMVAQHTFGGCPMRTGDLLGTGTISGQGTDKEYGSLLELNKNGKVGINIGSGATRMFLEDGDTVVLRGYGNVPGSAARVGFGECAGKVLPARMM